MGQQESKCQARIRAKREQKKQELIDDSDQSSKIAESEIKVEDGNSEVLEYTKNSQNSWVVQTASVSCSCDQQNDQKILIAPKYFEVVEEAAQNQEEDKQAEPVRDRRLDSISQGAATEGKVYSSDDEEAEEQMHHAVETLQREPAAQRTRSFRQNREGRRNDDTTRSLSTASLSKTIRSKVQRMQQTTQSSKSSKETPYTQRRAKHSYIDQNATPSGCLFFSGSSKTTSETKSNKLEGKKGKLKDLVAKASRDKQEKFEKVRSDKKEMKQLSQMSKLSPDLSATNPISKQLLQEQEMCCNQCSNRVPLICWRFKLKYMLRTSQIQKPN